MFLAIEASGRKVKSTHKTQQAAIRHVEGDIVRRSESLSLYLSARDCVCLCSRHCLKYASDSRAHEQMVLCLRIARVSFTHQLLRRHSHIHTYAHTHTRIRDYVHTRPQMEIPTYQRNRHQMTCRLIDDMRT